MSLLDNLMEVLTEDNEDLKKFKKLNDTLVTQEITKLKQKITEEV